MTRLHGLGDDTASHMIRLMESASFVREALQGNLESSVSLGTGPGDMVCDGWSLLVTTSMHMHCFRPEPDGDSPFQGILAVSWRTRMVGQRDGFG
jgi:hypothetical protein